MNKINFEIVSFSYLCGGLLLTALSTILFEGAGPMCEFGRSHYDEYFFKMNLNLDVSNSLRGDV